MTIDHLKDRLSALAEADYIISRLTDLARRQIEAAWDNLSDDDVFELESWLSERQSATRGEARIKWIYIRAAFASAQQMQGAV